jgi:hypothetical protein
VEWSNPINRSFILGSEFDSSWAIVCVTVWINESEAEVPFHWPTGWEPQELSLWWRGRFGPPS